MNHTDLPTRTEILTMFSQHESFRDLELRDYEVTSVTGHGSGDHRIYSMATTWANQPRNTGKTFVLKRWTPASLHAQRFNQTEPSEAIAFRTGLFNSLPESVHAPILAAIPAADGGDSWLLMTDVAEALDQYGRPNQFPFEQVKRKVSIVLDRLAMMHVQWESSDHLDQALREHRYHDWAAQLSVNAGAYRHALTRGATGDIVDGELIDEPFVDSLHAFLGWLPATLRPLWEQVLVDRSALVAAADGLPKTLLHGDMDDRNIGLSAGAQDADGRLTLIDWEWICIGPGGLDAAKPIYQLPASFLGEPHRITTYMDLLPEWGAEYAHYYRRHGGSASEAETFTGYQIGLACEAMSPYPRVIGGILLAQNGRDLSFDSVPAMELPRALFDVVLGWGAHMVDYVSDYLRDFMG